MRDFFVNLRVFACLLLLCANVCHFAVNAAKDVKGNLFPCVNSSQDVVQSFDNYSARGKGQRLGGTVPQGFGSAIVYLRHFDSLVSDARIVESGHDQFEAFAGLDILSRSVSHFEPTFRVGIYEQKDQKASCSNRITG